MSSNDPNESASDAGQFGPFASSDPYSTGSHSLDDLYNQYNPNDPLRPHPPRASRSPAPRFIIGMVIFIVSAELIDYLVVYANLRYKLNLTQPLFGAQLGGLNWLDIINFAEILTLLVILKRLGFFPNLQPRSRRDDSRWRE